MCADMTCRNLQAIHDPPARVVLSINHIAVLLLPLDRPL